MDNHFTQVTLSFAGVVTGATPDSPFSECLPSPRKWLAEKEGFRLCKNDTTTSIYWLLGGG